MSKSIRSSGPQRQLSELVSVGPATLRDLQRLEIDSVAELAAQQPDRLYLQLCVLDGIRHDPCCEDVFAAAIAQARDPGLPAEQRRWWYWSRLRKLRRAGTTR